MPCSGHPADGRTYIVDDLELGGITDRPFDRVERDLELGSQYIAAYAHEKGTQT